MLAIQNSQGMCRVVTSYENINADPELEVTKILQGLEGCGLPKQSVNKTHVMKFFDSSLHHRHNRANLCIIDIENEYVLAFKNAEDEYVVEKLKESTDEDINYFDEHYYWSAVNLYCDMKNGRAFAPDYEFN